MSELIPVITLWQPWAALIFTGDKLHETRSFRFPEKYAGRRIAIHSALAATPLVDKNLDRLCEGHWGGNWRAELPRGMLLGTVELVRWVCTDLAEPGPVDELCGDWSPGRYAWLLRDPKALEIPLSARGKQGWWSVEKALLGEAADA